MNEEVLENLKVVKRNGKKVNFDTTKVAIAIKKGFDGIGKTEDEEENSTTKDVQKVYQSVIKKIVKDYKNVFFCKNKKVNKNIEIKRI